MGVSVSFPTPTPTFPASSSTKVSSQNQLNNQKDCDDLSDDLVETARIALIKTHLPYYDDQNRCISDFNNYIQCVNSIVNGQSHCDFKHYEDLFISCSVVAGLTQPHKVVGELTIPPRETVSTPKSN